ncbi:MAG TPA: type II toxin-antitoxin system PemK/MazF family toxin [Gemmatimonadales bacterium]
MKLIWQACCKTDPIDARKLADLLRANLHGRGGTWRGCRPMAGVLRGEIRWADLNPTRGNEQARLRPVLILSHDVFNARSGTVIALAQTSQPQRAGFPLTLELTTPRLPRRSWVKISQIRTLAVERIGKRLSRASPEELAQVIEGLNEIVGA